jgi:hypothetical protein
VLDEHINIKGDVSVGKRGEGLLEVLLILPRGRVSSGQLHTPELLQEREQRAIQSM